MKGAEEKGVLRIPPTRLLLGIIAVIVLTAVMLSGMRDDKQSDLVVAATIFPVYDIVKNVVPDEVTVKLVLPPGASPHTFEPRPSTVRDIQSAHVVYVIGHGLDGWVSPLVESTGAPSVTVDKGVPLRTFGEEGGHEDTHEDVEGSHGHEGQDGEADDDHEHAHTDTDPHYWLDMENAALIARNVADDLSQRFPELADSIESNVERYTAELHELDRVLTDELRAIPGPEKTFISLHDAWGYFAEAYGLHIAGTYGPSPGQEPTPQYLAGLIAVIEESGAKGIFIEPQLSTESIKVFADDYGLTVLVLDPIGGVPGRGSYLELMSYNVRTVIEALQ